MNIKMPVKPYFSTNKTTPMMCKTRICFPLIFLVAALWGCAPLVDPEYHEQLRERLAQYKEVSLTADLDRLTEAEIEMIPILVDVAGWIDEIFWMQSYGSGEELLSFMRDPYARDYAEINYGPWGRLENHTPFYPGFDDKPLGANFYPLDIDREEFNEWDDPDKRSPYTMIRRTPELQLVSIPYAEAFATQNQQAAELLREAAAMADYAPMANYLEALAVALLTDNWREKDVAWLQMQDNILEFVAGPIDTGEDRKFGLKAAHSAYILVRDPEWDIRLADIALMLPGLQETLPVPPEYRREVPGTETDIGVYDALYYAGHCNAGPKIIALNLPRDPELRQQEGSRSMQIRNVMEAKFEEILLPISELLMHQDQQQHISFDGFFNNTVFHEISMGMGISRTVDDDRPVRDALREYHNTINVARADLMSLYLLSQMHEQGEISEEELHQAYITGFASIMRSSRFGAAGAHGIAAMMRFNHFAREEAFARDAETNTYRVDLEKMKAAVEKGLAELLTIQGDGDYRKAAELVNRDGAMSETLQEDLDRVQRENIPVDLVFDQGLEQMGLE